ncbi:MAG: hypothetical protein NWE79_08750 [Candidatus Bathyarchaeota archaeon]|nr:hypothetical protein [Candidatus Bathyarchaeota archaeon]
MVSDIVEHRGRQIQRLYPFAVSEVEGDGASADLLFCFAFFYINDEDEGVVFLTHPINLTASEDPGALEALLAEVEMLAVYLGSSLIEMEVHDQVTGSVAFPTSLSFISYDLNHAAIMKADAAHLQRLGFREDMEIVCLEQSVSGFERVAGGVDENHGGYVASPASPNEFATVKKALNSPVRSYEPTRSDNVFVPTHLPFFEDAAFIVRRRPRWLVRRGSVEGYLRWLPNIMEPSIEGRTPYPLLFHHALEDHVYSYGKIIDWGLSREDGELLTSLLSQAVKSMEQRGIQRFQLAHVDGEQRFVKKYLEESGFKMTHKIKLLRKEVG